MRLMLIIINKVVNEKFLRLFQSKIQIGINCIHDTTCQIEIGFYF